MAKTTTKKTKAPSLHSRAARRATSPSINTDKSLKDVQPPPESLNQRPSVLGLYQNAGVSKKSRKQGRKAVMSTRARRRHERGLERAEEIVDRTAVKVAKSKRSASNIAERKKAWDDVNGSVDKVGGASSNKFAGLAAADDEGEDEDEDEDKKDAVVELDDEMADAAIAASGGAASKAVATTAVAPPAPDDDDEIL